MTLSLGEMIESTKRSIVADFPEEIGKVVSFAADGGTVVGVVCRAFCEPRDAALTYDVAVPNRGIMRARNVFDWHGDIPNKLEGK